MKRLKTSMELKQIREKYQSYTRMIEILESGDIFDERYKLLLSSLTIQDVDNMRQFIAWSKDHGIHLTIKKTIN